MKLWSAVAYTALVLLAVAFFYVVLRWRRSPLARKGMAFVGGVCFLSGLLIGIWLFHVVSGSTVKVVQATPTPSPLPSLAPTRAPTPAVSPTSSKQAPQPTASSPLQPTATPTLKATPRPVPSVAANGAGSSTIPPTDWLGRVNFYRSLAKVHPVVEDPSLSAGDVLHAKYLVKNRVPPDSRAHEEDSSNPWFTAGGAAAAQSSDVVAPCTGCREISAAQAIDMWMSGPFHRVSLLNPDLRRVGYGEFREGGLKAHAISVGGAWLKPGLLAAPVVFPADGTSIRLNDFGGEWPDPLSACVGFRVPAGLPITIELGSNAPTAIGQHEFKDDGRPLQHCVFGSSSYTNQVESAQQWGRRVLNGFGAVVLIPRSPLIAGHRYSVDLVVNSKHYAWSFSVAR